MNRRNFILSSTSVLLSSQFSFGQSKKTIQTVNGLIDPKEMGFTLAHEHVLVDFIGAEKVSRSRYDVDEAFNTALPFLKSLKETGCNTFIECTPAYIGRDPQLLKRLSDASGLHILTNTGYYGAAGEKYIPKHAFTETAEQLAARWIEEFKNGIEGTGIKPGFVKTGTDSGPLTVTQRKLIKAAALTHKSTGLTILVHTGNGAAAKEQVAILKEEGVHPSARVWTHAQNEPDGNQHVTAAKESTWVSFDGVNPDSLEQNLSFLLTMKSANVLDNVLVSHDAGWYHVGEPNGGSFSSFTTVSKQFIPLLKKNGFTEKEIDQIFRVNPSKAFPIVVRTF